jgi:hypothetical protein
MKFLILAIVFILSSCVAPFGSQNKGTLHFQDARQIQNLEKLLIEKKLEEKKQYALEKMRVIKEINSDAQESYKFIQVILQNKCASCHDENVKLPIYGRIFKQINPVTRHQVEGLRALNFGAGFPFKAMGSPPQIALLKAIRNAVTDRTMPIKAYTLVYPHKKITAEDQQLILDWIDPIVDRLQEYDMKYNSSQKNVSTQAIKILEMKCFRCHANGNVKGEFGNMENVSTLLHGKYVNLNYPDQSKITNLINSGKMPPNKRETLDIDEANIIRDWLELESKKAQTK